MIKHIARRRLFQILVVLPGLMAGLVFAGDQTQAGSDTSEPAPIVQEKDGLASEPAKEQVAMSHHIIRAISMSHCKRGPESCPKCRAVSGPRICLLDIAPPDQGMVQRRVIEVQINGERVWREFDVIRVFAGEAEARAWAAEHKVDIDLAAPAE